MSAQTYWLQGAVGNDPVRFIVCDTPADIPVDLREGELVFVKSGIGLSPTDQSKQAIAQAAVFASQQSVVNLEKKLDQLLLYMQTIGLGVPPSLMGNFSSANF